MTDTSKKFVVYRSSAGSGKTFTLAREFLRIVIGSPFTFRHILAITFTNKAANEMRERILKYLSVLSDTSDNVGGFESEVLQDYLVRTLNISPEQIRGNASMVLGNILHNYSDFAVNTIDSFMHRIIRSFAHDMKLSAEFEVELETDDLLKACVDILISKAGIDKRLTRALIEFVSSRMDVESDWRIENSLYSFSREVFNETASPYLESLDGVGIDDFISAYQYFLDNKSDFENDISTIASNTIRVLSEAGLSQNDFFQKARGLWAYFERIAHKDYSKLQPNNYVLKSFEEDHFLSSGISSSQIAAFEGVKALLCDNYEQLQDVLTEKYQEYCLYKNILQTIFPLSLLRSVKDILEDYKAENNILPINEFNPLLSEHIRNEPVPFVYERAGERYHHLLIDEFQDTSVMQWHNLLPLVHNGLANNAFNLVVGDGKQAIYRWRNGEVEQLAHLPKIYKKSSSALEAERERALVSNYQEESLDKNYRSAPEIVDFINDMFSFLKQKFPDVTKRIYDKHKQVPGRTDMKAYISISLYDKNNSSLDFEAFNLEKCHDIVVKLMGQNFAKKDIALLCRTNTEASRLASYLMEKGIAVISPESLLLKFDNEVNLLIAVLRYLCTPEWLCFAEIYRYFAQGGNDWQDFSLHAYTGMDIEARPAYKDLERLFKDNGYTINLKHLSHKSLFATVESLISSLRMNQHTSLFIRSFLELAYDFSLKAENSIDGFLEYWDNKKHNLSIHTPDGVDAVTILTIHKSKGLQFPVVIMPFLKKARGGHANYLWATYENNDLPYLKSVLLKEEKGLENTDYRQLYEEEQQKKLLDTINLFYVGLSRPSRKLFLISDYGKDLSEGNQSVPDFIVSFLLEKQLFDPNVFEYEFGKDFSLDVSKRIIASTEAYSQMISSSWKENIALSYMAPAGWEVGDPHASFAYGILIHELLAKIEHSDDVDDALKEIENKGLNIDIDAGLLERKIKGLISSPAIKPFFQDIQEVYIEKNILMPDGTIIRPDRIVLKNNIYYIIDYKTGKQKGEHKAQIRKYVEALSSMFDNDIKGVLLYSEENQLIEVA